MSKHTARERPSSGLRLVASPDVTSGEEGPARDSFAASLTTLLITDLVDSTGLVERLGDARASRLFARHDAMARALLAAHDGREIDKTDGFLLLFERPVHALAYALAYHANLRQLAVEEKVSLAARSAIHVGEVFLRDNPPEEVARGAKPLEVEGLAKIVAARLMSLAQGGQTLLTRSAFDLARRAAPELEGLGSQLAWLAHGSYQLKGIGEAIEVFEVGTPGIAPLRPPPAGEKGRPVAGADTVLGWRPAAGQLLPGRAHWRLETKLGEGGFGEVWLAHHVKTREGRVFKFCFGREQVRALQREVTLCRVLRETLGNRPDITRILDWNLEEAPFFLEFEYQGGLTLGEWVERNGGFAAIPLATRLDLAAQAAEAVAAAHSVGVLHKDIKPSNILVITEADGRPRVQVTDFGVGRLTEPAKVQALGITALGLTDVHEASTDPTAGTRLYLAPEVLEGKPATTQADIYSLGVVIYQLVVGDLARVVAPGWEREVEDPILRGDLAAFLDGRPDRRVGSAQEMARRLRSLEERRVQARLAELAEAEAEATRIALERVRRRRRAAVVVGTAAALCALALALLARGLAVERDRANREAAAAQRVTDFLLSVFQVSDPSEARGNTITARELLDRGAAQVEKELSDQPLVRARLADAIGTVYVQLGLLEQGEKLLRSAWEWRRQHLGESHPETANSEADLGWVAEKRGNAEVAERHYRHALALRQRQGLVPDLVDAKVHASLGWALVEQARWSEARDHIRTALSLQEKLGSPTGGELADTLTTLAFVHFKLGEYREAAEMLRRVLAIQERVHGPDTLQVAATKNNLAVQLREMGQLEEALALYHQALAVQEQALGAQHPDLGSFFNNIGHIHQDRGEFAKAESWFRRALQVRLAGLGEEHPLTALSLNNLGYCLWQSGDIDEAEALWRRALAARERRLGPSHPETAITRGNLGLVFLARGQFAQARAHFEEALAAAHRGFGGDRPAMLGMLEGYQALLRHLGEVAAAEEVAARSRALREQAASRGERLPPPVVIRRPS